VGLVVLSWITSPLFSGIIAALIFLVVRRFILRSPDAVERGFKFFPLLVFFTFMIFCFYVTFKNSQVELKTFRKESPGLAVLMALACAMVLAGIAYALTIGKIREWVAQVSDTVEVIPEAKGAWGAPEGTEGQQEQQQQQQQQKPTFFWNQDLHAAACEEEARAAELREESEQFPAKTEKLFSYLQVVSAAFDSLAHGANDAANAVGPLAAIWGIHEAGKVDSKVEVPIWILAMGGVAMSIGLLTYGYNVIKSIGIKLTTITPSRGFSIEMGSSIVVIIGSNLGIPLSTTHCQVGATVGVGLCENNGFTSVSKGVNWKLMGKVVFMWVATLAFAGICSSAIFGFLSSAYHPMSKPLECGKIMNNIGSLPNVWSNITKSDMQALFVEIDADGDEVVDSDELKSHGLDKTLKGDKVVEKYGRRRRRTPKTMTESDFLLFTCVKVEKLDHMQQTKCEPRCLPGFRADTELSCKLSSGANQEGGFQLGASYSGFTGCV